MKSCNSPGRFCSPIFGNDYHVHRPIDSRSVQSSISFHAGIGPVSWTAFSIFGSLESVFWLSSDVRRVQNLKKHRVLSSSVFVALVAGLLLGVIGILGKEWITDAMLGEQTLRKPYATCPQPISLDFWMCPLLYRCRHSDLCLSSSGDTKHQCGRLLLDLSTWHSLIFVFENWCTELELQVQLWNSSICFSTA